MKKLIALILVIAMVLTCAGCKVASEELTTPTTTEPDFTIEKANADTGIGASIFVITDTETGDRYMFVKAGYGGGLTKMEGNK